jgi:hypothetical protein
MNRVGGIHFEWEIEGWTLSVECTEYREWVEKPPLVSKDRFPKVRLAKSEVKVKGSTYSPTMRCRHCAMSDIK